MTPPLPPNIITEILSHLLPPLPPIPDHLIAKGLFDRITFLPPDEDDLDAWLSPVPPTDSTSTLGPLSGTPGEATSKAHILGDRLKRLYDTGYTLGPVLYAHDGEHLLARLPIIPQDFHSTRPTPSSDATSIDSHNDVQHGIDVMFIHESEDRGWVYQSSRLPTHPHSPDTDHLSWSSIETSLPVTPQTCEGEMTPDEYWKGFASPKPGYAHPGAIEGEEEEDAYWALYAQSGGQSGVGTRNQSVADFGQMRSESNSHAQNGTVELDGVRVGGKDDASSIGHDIEGESRVEQDETGSGRVMCDLPTQNGALDPLAALLSTIPDRLTSNRSRSDTIRRSSVSSHSYSEVSPALTSAKETNDLRDKVNGRIQSPLRSAWMEYTKDAGESHEDLEIKAMSWLRIGRGVFDPTPGARGGGGGGGEGAQEQVVRAKIEVLWDMFGTVSTTEAEERKEVFWRLIEGCVKKPVVPGIEEQGLTQEMYWE